MRPFTQDKIEFLEQCGFFIAIVDCNLKVNYCSDAWQESYLSKINEVNKAHQLDSVFTLFKKSQSAKLKSFLNTLDLEHEPSVPITLQLENEKHWFECRIALNKDNDPDGERKTAYLFICSDITETYVKDREHSLLSELATKAGALLNVGYWQLDVETQTLYWSDEIYNIHQVDKATYRPDVDSALAFYHPNDVDEIKQYVKTALEQGKGWVCQQLRIITPAGEERFILTSGNVALNEGGEPERLYGIFQDITKQEKTYLERDFLATALREATVGMVVADGNKQVIWANSAFERMTGYQLEDVRGNKLGPVLQGDKTDTLTKALLSKKLRDGEAVRTRILDYHKSGKPYWNELSITPINKGDELAYFFTVQNDVTAEVEAKEALEQLNSSLEQQVEQRTLDLAKANYKLQQQANIDHLTQCLNRRTLGETLSRISREVATQNSQMALLMLDIDHFKSINDTYGHQAGDIVLQSIANKLKSLLRSQDYVFRMGGEEFLIIMSHLASAESYRVAERIRKEIAEMTISVEKHKIDVTISIGLISYAADITPEKALKQADDYLYQAKAKGRNQIVSG